jgi:hypothetical protein
MAIHNPPQFINAYLKDQLAEFQFGSIPFFPTNPSSIDQLTQSFVINGADNSAGIFSVYDRMFKMRRGPFPHIKSEQLLYYFYGTAEAAIENLIEITQRIQDLLDTEDESAQALNAYAKAKQASNSPLRDKDGDPLLLPFFHKVKIYQLEETRDIVDFGTARTFAGNKIIIDYDWHKSD